jgi:hypothetical protein
MKYELNQVKEALKKLGEERLELLLPLSANRSLKESADKQEDICPSILLKKLPLYFWEYTGNLKKNFRTPIKENEKISWIKDYFVFLDYRGEKEREIDLVKTILNTNKRNKKIKADLESIYYGKIFAQELIGAGWVWNNPYEIRQKLIQNNNPSSPNI